MFTSIPSCVLLLSCLLQATLSASHRYGDAAVILSKDFHSKKQVNLYLGDQFLVDVTLRRSAGRDEYKDISRFNVTQIVKGISKNKNVTFVLERVENNLFNVTSVYPVNQVGGKYQTVVSATVYPRNMYNTTLEVSNSRNDTFHLLSNRNIRKIVLRSYGIVTNPGVCVMILPFSG